MMEEEREDEPCCPEPRIFVVDDDALVRRALARHLGPGMQVHEAASGEEALQKLREGFDVHVMLVDYAMPGLSGIDVLKESRLLAPRTRRILMTGDLSGDVLQAAINEGKIHHFLKKPIHPDELKAVLQQMFEMIRLERKNDLLLMELKFSNDTLKKTLEELKHHKELLQQSLDERTQELMRANRELEAANRQLQAQAMRDGLTGLYNHATLVARLEEELARARRYCSQLSVLFCDIDHFKQYNDRLGHAVGDVVLRTVANFLVSGSATVSPSRKSDIVGRYGGEEFVVILPETDKGGAMVRAQRLCDGVRGLDVPGAADQPLGFLSMSLGVATYPADAATVNELLHAADTALYRAKAEGRNRVVGARKEP